jgi:hypothetical protein
VNFDSWMLRRYPLKWRPAKPVIGVCSGGGIAKSLESSHLASCIQERPLTLLLVALRYTFRLLLEKLSGFRFLQQTFPSMRRK